MALIQPQITQVLDANGSVVAGAFIWAWLNVSAADTCAPARLPNHADKSIQCAFVSGSGQLWGVEGSNDPTLTVWADLNDPQGNALTGVNAAKIEQILESPAYIRPKVPGGTTPVVNYFLHAYASARRG